MAASGSSVSETHHDRVLVADEPGCADGGEVEGPAGGQAAGQGKPGARAHSDRVTGRKITLA